MIFCTSATTRNSKEWGKYSFANRGDHEFVMIVPDRQFFGVIEKKKGGKF